MNVSGLSQLLQHAIRCMDACGNTAVHWSALRFPKTQDHFPRQMAIRSTIINQEVYL